MARPSQARPIVDPADDLLVNGNLRLRRGTLRGWDVCFHECGTGILRDSPTGTIIRPTGAGYVEVSQSIRAYANQRYRLDVHVEAVGCRRPVGQGLSFPQLTKPIWPHGRAQATDERWPGSIQPRFVSLRAGEEIRSYEPPVMHVGGDAPVIHRATVQCPPRTGRLLLRLRIQASQPILVKRLRLVETGDYLLASHVLASTPLPSHELPPCRPDSVLLCDGRKDDRPLLRWLRGTFGEKQVRRVRLGELASEHAHLPDIVLPRDRNLHPGGGRGTRRLRPDQRGGTPRGQTVQPSAIVIDLPEDRAPSCRTCLPGPTGRSSSPR